MDKKDIGKIFKNVHNNIKVKVEAIVKSLVIFRYHDKVNLNEMFGLDGDAFYLKVNTMPKRDFKASYIEIFKERRHK